MREKEKQFRDVISNHQSSFKVLRNLGINFFNCKKFRRIFYCRGSVVKSLCFHVQCQNFEQGASTNRTKCPNDEASGQSKKTMQLRVMGQIVAVCFNFLGRMTNCVNLVKALEGNHTYKKGHHNPTQTKSDSNNSLFSLKKNNCLLL